jgi:high-affinity Fe2+/Pb2+ permease
MNAPLDWISVLIGCTGVGLLALAAGMVALVLWQSRRIEAKRRQKDGQPDDEQRRI